MSLVAAFWTDWRRWIWMGQVNQETVAVIQAAEDKCYAGKVAKITETTNFLYEIILSVLYKIFSWPVRSG